MVSKGNLRKTGVFLFEADEIILKCTNTINEDTVLDKLLEKEKECFELFKTENHLSRKQVEVKMKISQPFAVNLLTELTKNGLIRRIGSGKNTRYESKLR